MNQLSECECQFQHTKMQELSQEGSRSREVVLEQLSSADNKGRKRRFKTFLEECRFDLVRETLLEWGAVDVNYTDPWVIAWTDTAFSMKRFTKMKPYQKINHFPGMSQVCKKDLLATNLKRMRTLCEKEYDFFPPTFCLPDESRSLSEYCQSRKRRQLFIVKPHNQCQGSGIAIVKGLDNAKKYRNVVCQKYISMPLLMNGFKVDLRLYALITSVTPLRVYVYKKGLVRLATVCYKKPRLSNMHEKRMHLTNYAINRSTDLEDSGGQPCKKSFSELEAFLDSLAVNRDLLWPTIDGMIVKTLLSVLPALQHMSHTCFPMQSPLSPCFEILGFDVLLDSRIRPYLLEVNRSPSLGGTSEKDKHLKKALVENVLDMVLPTPKQISLLNDEQRMKSVRRLTDPNATNSILHRRLTDKEVIVAERQEQRELEKLGSFRRIFPVEDGRYNPVIRTIFKKQPAIKIDQKSRNISY